MTEEQQKLFRGDRNAEYSRRLIRIPAVGRMSILARIQAVHKEGNGNPRTGIDQQLQEKDTVAR